MKKILTYLILLISLSAWSQKDMNVYLKETKQLIQKKSYKKALKRCIWFHNHALEHDPSMFSVRLSFALADWKLLSDQYEPAKKALLKTRDEKIKKLYDGTIPPLLFLDVLSINRILHLESENVKLFESLKKHNKYFAKKHWKMVKKDLYATKRFDLLKEYIGNPMMEFEQNFKIHLKNSDICNPDSEYEQRKKTYSEERFANRTLQLIQLALSIKDYDAAKEIQRRALELVDDYRIENAIKE